MGVQVCLGHGADNSLHSIILILPNNIINNRKNKLNRGKSVFDPHNQNNIPRILLSTFYTFTLPISWYVLSIYISPHYPIWQTWSVYQLLSPNLIDRNNNRTEGRSDFFKLKITESTKDNKKVLFVLFFCSSAFHFIIAFWATNKKKRDAPNEDIFGLSVNHLLIGLDGRSCESWIFLATRNDTIKNKENVEYLMQTLSKNWIRCRIRVWSIDADERRAWQNWEQ